MPAINLRLISPKLIVDIGDLADLRGVAMKDDILTIGALTRHVDLQRSPEIAAHAPLLRDAIGHVGHPAIRNRGTIGGSLAHADPASELPACMVALGATIVARGPGGERRIAAEEFFTGIYETALSPQELLVAIELPAARKHSAHFFRSSPGDMAIMPLSGWRRRRHSTMINSPISGLLSLLSQSGLRPEPRGCLSTPRSRRRCCPRPLAHSAKSSIPGRPPGVSRHAPASYQGLAGALCVRVTLRAEPFGGRGHVTDLSHLSLVVNGEPVDAQVLPRLNLADFLREHLKLTGTHVGCEHGVCGACTVRVDGEIVRSCLMLAVQTQNASVETIEGLSDSGEISDLQSAFRDRNALQCGFCTPGMLMAAQDLLRHSLSPNREQIREHLSGNYCRCTGYHAIVDAVEATAQARRERRP